MDKHENRREAFRLHDEISLTVTKISDESLDTTLDNFEKRRADFGLLSHLKFDVEKYLPQMRVIEHRYPDIARYLKFLERQIEFLTAHVSGAYEPEELEKTAVELSAGGIQFVFPDECKVGDYLEAAMILYPDETRLLTILEVCRVELVSEGKHAVSGEFFHIHEADQEAMVKHVHRKQIEELRK